MRHKKHKFLLNRFTSFRKSTLVSLARSIIKSPQQRIITTKTKAKAVSRLIEKLIRLAKQDSLTCRRRVYQVLCDHKLVSYLFKEIAPLFKNRTSGFTRIIRYKNRRGDNAELVILELTEKKEPPKKIKKEKKEAKPLPQVKEELPEQKPPTVEKPTKKFLGGIKSIFKKERDAL